MRARACAAVAALLMLAGCAGTGTGAASFGPASRQRVAAAAEASGQVDIALSMYGAAAEGGGGEAIADFAAALARHGEAARAEQLVRRGLERHPAHLRLTLQLGRLQLRAGEGAAALETFHGMLARNPDLAAARGGEAVALDLLGRPEEAERSHRLALALAPEDLRIANNLAVSLLLAGRPAEAAVLLERLQRQPSAPARIGVNLALARAAASAGGTGEMPLVTALARLREGEAGGTDP